MKETKTISLVCVLVLVISVMTGSGLAFSESSESELSDPSLDSEGISDWYELDDIRDDPGGNYHLENDLTEETDGYDDLVDTEDGWEPIGYDDDNSWHGTFDGNYHVIEDLYIDVDGDWGDDHYVGLFGRLEDETTIENVGLENVDINVHNHEREAGVGVLVGESFDPLTLNDVYTTGDLYVESTDSTAGVGGLGGRIMDATVSNSYSHVHVETVDEVAVGGLGGLVAHTLEDSYSTGEIDHGGEEPLAIGALIGYSVATVQDSMALESDHYGHEYDLIGLEDGHESIGRVTDAPEEDMMEIGLYEDDDFGDYEALEEAWDIEAVDLGEENEDFTWNIVDGETLPFLSWEGNPIDVTGEPISDWHDLDDVRDEPEEDYYLENNLDEDTDGYDELVDTGGGWEPIGDFEGTFDGAGNVIEDLYIDREAMDGVGLFGALADGAEIIDLGVENAEVWGDSEVGVLAGSAWETVELDNLHATGELYGDASVGGLVGLVADAEATVRNSHAEVDIEGIDGGSESFGGLVGLAGLGATIENSHATGDILARETWSGGVGGLVGAFLQGGEVTDSYATGEVVGGRFEIGGLIGRAVQDIQISNSFATGDVIGDYGEDQDDDQVGGLVGLLDEESTVEKSYATGDVVANHDDGSGATATGGLIGETDGSVVKSSYATGDVVGEDSVGGLIGSQGDDQAGSNDDELYDSYAVGSVEGDENVGTLLGMPEQSEIYDSMALEDPDYELIGDDDEDEIDKIGRVTEASESEMMNIGLYNDDDFGDYEALDEEWDIVDVEPEEENEDYTWNIVDGLIYPFLSWDENPAEGVVELEVSVESDTDEGWVEVADMEIEAGETETIEYSVDEEAELVADDSPVGTLFDEWTGDYEGEEKEIAILMDDDKEVTANFIEGLKEFDLDLTLEGEGTVTAEWEEDDGTEYEEVVEEDTTLVIEETSEVELTAEAEEDWLFYGWTGTYESLDETITFDMDEDKEMTADFEEVNEITDWYDLDEVRDDLSAPYRLENDLDEDTDGYEDMVSERDVVEEVEDEEIGNAWDDEFETTYSPIEEGTLTLEIEDYGEPDEDDYTVDYEEGIIIPDEPFSDLYDEVASFDDVFADYTLEVPLAEGWIPLGGEDEPFTGLFEGNDHSIEGLHIHRSDEDYIGLFGQTEADNIGEITDLELSDVTITGNEYVGALTGRTEYGTISNIDIDGEIVGHHWFHVGGLTGYNTAEITNVHLTVEVEGDERAGGLAHYNSGTVTEAHVEEGSRVEGIEYVGGLIGNNDGDIYSSSFAGEVDHIGDDGDNFAENIGGLIGDNSGNIEDSYSTGDVILSEPSWVELVGGFIGDNSGDIEGSYATGELDITEHEETSWIVQIGGLVGTNSGDIEDSYAEVDVTGEELVGGLIGENDEASITNSHATGDVTGEEYVGGLIGENDGPISDSYAEGTIQNIEDDGEYFGGLVGRNSEDIEDSYALGNVEITGDGHVAGGFVGRNEGTIERSFAEGDVEAYEYVGGLVGMHEDEDIIDSYAQGDVTSSSDISSYTGGLVGDSLNGDLENSYAAGTLEFEDEEDVGALAGRFEATVTDSMALESEGYDLIGGLEEDYDTVGRVTEAPEEHLQDIGLYTEDDFEDYDALDEAWDIVEVNPEEENEDYTWNIVDRLISPFLSHHDNPAEMVEYELTVDVEGEGEVEIDPEQDEYDHGTEVDLTAIPDDNHEFAEWTGDYEGEEEEITITMDDDKEVTAHFEIDIDEVDDVVIYPDEYQIVVYPGEELEFEAEAYDQDGNLITDDDSEFTWNNTDEEGIFQEKMGDHFEVNATIGGVTSDTTIVTVVQPAEPELEITEVVNDIEDETITIRGETELEVDITIRINEEETTIESVDEFDHTGELQEGENYIEVLVEDEAGNIAEKEFQALYMPQITEIRDDLENLEDEIDENRANINELEKDFEDLELDFDVLTDRVDDLEVALEENVTSLEETIESNEENITHIQENISEIWSELDYIDSEIDQILNEIGELDSDIGDVRGYIDDLNHTTDDLGIEIEEIDDNLRDEIGYLEASLEENVTELNTLIGDNADDISNVEGCIDEIQGDITEIRGELEEIDEEIVSLLEQNDELWDALDDYLTEEEIHAVLEDFVTDDSFEEVLENYLTEEEINNVISQLEEDMNDDLDEQDDEIDLLNYLAVAGILLAIIAIILILVSLRKNKIVNDQEDVAQVTEEDEDIIEEESGEEDIFE